MNHWYFVIGAYALTFIGTALLCLVSWRTMQSAEAEAQRFTDRS